ncbi:MAG: DUF3035 domain-containing protein [Magnetospirillum sp.]|nr:DUF3035 domain-containing protein [Magnetospirillum sp.]
MTKAVRLSTLFAAAALLPLLLSGCTEAKRALGYEKSPPDEFQVVQRAPLAMPPDFSLRPPAPGTARPQEGSTREQARKAITGGRAVTPIATANRTKGDVALLKKAGAEDIQPDIRVLINKETQALAEMDKSFTDKLVFWRKPDGPGSGEQLDASKEVQRLRQNQALGKTVSDGDTPRIAKRKKALLQGILK